ncbi:MAG: hypothetical protein JNK60_07010, partial [Acidobacteria bacterium]|nr:hypothetical protein [Acidobacteriota bacterium]
MRPEARALSNERYEELLSIALAKNPSTTMPLGAAAKGLAERGLEEDARRANVEALHRHAPFEARLLHAADLAGSGRLREAVEAFEALHRV